MKGKNLINSIIATLLLSSSITYYADAATVSQQPLALGSGSVPGNLSLVPSVEFPTVLSVANIGAYNENRESVGYFDSKKCYRYQNSSSDGDRHFVPVSITANFQCPGNVWSGNFLNWAATSTIDPFRWALTGGYRIKDTVTETWLEAARHTGTSNLFATRTISGSGVVNRATPFSTSSISLDRNGLGNRMRFTLPAGHGFNNLTSAKDNIVFADSQFSATLPQFGSGRIERSSIRSVDNDGFSLLKTGSFDPNGGFLDIGSIQSFDNFLFEAWFFRPSTGSQSLERISLSDSGANGIGFVISPTGIGFERRRNGSFGGGIGGSDDFNFNFQRPRDEWFRVVLQSESGNRFRLTVFSSTGVRLAAVTSVADVSFSNFSRIYIHGGINYFIDNIRLTNTSAPAQAFTPISTNTFEASVRVKVCDPSIGVESNCRRYGNNWKPEGLIQRNADNIRYSIFGYLNDDNVRRDGGVLRAEQKFVGPLSIVPGTGPVANPNKEWDENTGVLVRNPDKALATDTGTYYGVRVDDSGVINYLNKFGQLNNNSFKSFDPVSELYYTAIRYFKNQGNVDAYSSRNGARVAFDETNEKWVDNFPVSRNWSDPIQYACQKNVVLGIGDVNTHRDKNLPSTSTLGRADEPAIPPEVSADVSVDVRNATDRVALLEGISINTTANDYTGRRNSAFMAGIAYDANTRDIRPNANDFTGKQTVQTYWVDVLENQVLQPRERNQYWLTAKYGGFQVQRHPRCNTPGFTPTGNECGEQSLGDPYARTAPLPEWWWYTNNDTLNPNFGSDYRRTDNFYTAGDARNMIDGLTNAFASITASVRGSGSAIAANSGRIGTGSALFNTELNNTFWSGDVVAKAISSDGVPATTNTWSAAALLDALPEDQLVNRKIFTSRYASEDSTTGIKLNSGGVAFKWNDLSSEQKALLRQTPANGPSVTAVVGEQRLNFLRGSRLLEQSETNVSNPFRRRASRLGDIVNSSPQFLSRRNFRFSSLGAPFASNVGSSYSTYRQSQVYVSKPPVVIAGANDGMLHIFNASLGSDGGKELFAYVPSNSFQNLYELSEPNYTHRFYVDGPARVADAWFDPNDVPSGVASGWKTVAAVTLGAGGKGVSLLDISDPNNMNQNSVLWEFSHKDMGSLIQQPFITALPNGKFGVIVTSGFEHGASEASIWILNVANGAVIKQIKVPTAGGLAQATPLDLNRDRIVDRIVVGDTLGNLWRFDLLTDNVANWLPPLGLRGSGNVPIPFFIAVDAAGNRQPITAAVDTAFDRSGRSIVLFGTGSYHLENDNQVSSSSQVQNLYGVLDLGVVITRAQLLQQEVLLDNTVRNARVTSNNRPQSTDRGWYLDLQWPSARGGTGPLGELINSRPILNNGRATFVSIVPSADPCLAGGTDWTMTLDISTGANLGINIFDINQDRKFDSSDFVEVLNPDGTKQLLAASGTSLGRNGIANIGKESLIRVGDSFKLCVSTSNSTELTCYDINGELNQGRKGWREVR